MKKLFIFLMVIYIVLTSFHTIKGVSGLTVTLNKIDSNNYEIVSSINDTKSLIATFKHRNTIEITSYSAWYFWEAKIRENGTDTLVIGGDDKESPWVIYSNGSAAWHGGGHKYIRQVSFKFYNDGVEFTPSASQTVSDGKLSIVSIVEILATDGTTPLIREERTYTIIGGKVDYKNKVTFLQTLDIDTYYTLQLGFNTSWANKVTFFDYQGNQTFDTTLPLADGTYGLAKSYTSYFYPSIGTVRLKVFVEPQSLNEYLDSIKKAFYWKGGTINKAYHSRLSGTRKTITQGTVWHINGYWAVLDEPTLTPEKASITQITITPSTTNLKPNQTEQFNATDQDGNPINPTWSTSDNNIATIDQSGLLTALKVGTVTVKADIGGVTNTATVTVNLADVSFPITKPTLTDKGAISELFIDIANLISSDKVIVEKATIPEGQSTKQWSYFCDASLVSGTLASGTWKAEIDEKKYIGNHFFRFKVVR